MMQHGFRKGRRPVLAAAALVVLLAAGASAADQTDGSPATAPASVPAPGDPEQPAVMDLAATEPPVTEPAVAEPAVASLPGRPLLQLDELSLELGFEAEWRRRRTVSDGRGTRNSEYRQHNTARRFEETLGLRAAGHVFDERAVRYFIDVRGGLAQERYSEVRPGPDLHTRPSGDVSEYDLRLNLLPAGKISANLAAFRQDERVPRMFLPSLDRQRERYLAELLYNDRTLPMRLAFESEYEELRSPSWRITEDERRGDRRLKYEATWQPSEDHQLRLDYEYNDRREQYSGTATRFDTTRNYLTLNHVLRFGADRRSRIDTVARFQEESGDLARDVYEVAPQLRLQHTDALASTARGQFLRESYDGRAQELFRGELGLHYQPTPGLDAALNAYALSQQVEEAGDLDEWGGVATLAAFRELDSGRLSLQASYQHAWVRSDESGQFAVIIGEAVTFRDPLPAILSRTEVQPGSILVTDAARRRTYLLGRDYTTISLGRYTALLRVRSGRIVDGETALVSYRQRVSQGYSLTRDRFDFRIQHEFRNGLTPYYAVTLQEEDAEQPRNRGYLPRDIQRHRLGLTWRRKRASVGAELEYNDDAIDPFRAAHVRGDSEFFERAAHALNGRASASFFRFDGTSALEPREATLVDLGLHWRSRLTQQLEATAVAAYRFEDDTRFGRTHGVDLSGALHWRIGLFTASFEVEYDWLSLPDSRDGVFAAWIKLRREFPLIGRSSR